MQSRAINTTVWKSLGEREKVEMWRMAKVKEITEIMEGMTLDMIEWRKRMHVADLISLLMIHI